MFISRLQRKHVLYHFEQERKLTCPFFFHFFLFSSYAPPLYYRRIAITMEDQRYNTTLFDRRVNRGRSSGIGRKKKMKSMLNNVGSQLMKCANSDNHDNEFDVIEYSLNRYQKNASEDAWKQKKMQKKKRRDQGISKDAQQHPRRRDPFCSGKRCWADSRRWGESWLLHAASGHEEDPRHGVQQGMVLSPLLVIICIDDPHVCIKIPTIRHFADNSS